MRARYEGIAWPLAAALLVCSAGTSAQQPQLAQPNQVAPQAADAAEAGTGHATPVDSGPGELELLPQTPASEGGVSADEVARRALKHSPAVRQAGQTEAHAGRRAYRARYIFVPRVDVSANYTRLSDVPEPNVGGMSLGGVFPILLDNFGVRAGLSVPVSDYFLTFHDRYKGAQHYEVFTQLQLEGERQAAAYVARRQYYMLARALAARRLAEHRTLQLQGFVAEIDTLVRGGELGAVDLAQARARMAAAKASAQRARADEQVATDTLRRSMGMEHGVALAVGEALTSRLPEPPRDLLALKTEALRERPEARALEALLRVRGRNRDAAAGERYPKLSVLGDLLVANPNQRYIPAAQEFNTTWSVGVELAWSPTDLFVQNQTLEDRELEVSQVEQDIRALRDRIIVEVTTAYENAVAAAAAVDTSWESVEAAEESVRVQLALFRGGETTSRVVLDAELDYRVSQLRWVDDILTTHLAEAALDQALGRRNY